MTKAINLRRVLTLTGVISLALLYVLLWTRMISTPGERVGSDFIGLYTGLRISQSQGFPFIYDVEYQQEVQRQVVGFEFHPDQTGYFTHPPFILLLALPIPDENYVISLVGWTIILLLLNTITVFILMRVVSMLNFTSSEFWLLAAGTFLFLPTFSGVMNGQDVAILLLGASLWMLLSLRGKQLAAGLGLSLTVIRPQMAILLSVPYVLRHRRIFAGFMIGGLLLALISLWLIGSTGLSDYRQLLGVVEGGMYHNPHARDMPGLGGLIRRTFETVDPSFFRYAILSWFLTGLIVSILLWRKQAEFTEQQIGLLILLGLIFVPYAHYHELTLLLIPIFCLIRLLAVKKLVSTQNLAMLPLIISFILLPGFIGSDVFKYLLVHMVMLILGYLLLFPEKVLRSSAPVSRREGPDNP